MDFVKAMEKTREINRLFDEIKVYDKNMMHAVLCMVIDHCALESGMKSAELIDLISPIIMDVNDAMGTDGIA